MTRTIKNMLLLLTLTLICTGMWAQQKQIQTTYNAYCEVTINNGRMDQFTIMTFDFGYTRYPNALLYDEKGQPIKFRSPMDAVNYLGERGWRLVTTYYSNDSKGQLRHYILEKKVNNRKQMEEGLRLQPQSKSNKSVSK